MALTAPFFKKVFTSIEWDAMLPNAKSAPIQIFFLLDCPSHCYDAVSLCETAYIRDNNPHLRWVLNERQTILRNLRDEHQGPIATKVYNSVNSLFGCTNY